MSNNIKTFESFSYPINEEAALPKMPDFLKKAGAKEDHFHGGGPVRMNPPNNSWIIEVKSPKGIFKKEHTWGLVFFPNGTFTTGITPEDSNGPFDSGGKWKASPSDSFTMLNKKIQGVSMTFNSLFSPTTYM